MAQLLKVSIITVCLNAEKCIEPCLRSTAEQTYSNIEHVIIDGQSTDRTLSIVNDYKRENTIVVSEKDAGIYDAMNKGLERASGDIIYFLNSDDRLFDRSVIADIVNEYKKNESIDILLGKVVFEYPKTFKGPHGKMVDISTKLDVFKYGLCHQRIFATRRVFSMIGNFNTQYRVCADQDWVFRALNKGFVLKNIDRYVAYFYGLGFHTQDQKLRINEKRLALFKNSSLFEFITIACQSYLDGMLSSERT